MAKSTPATFGLRNIVNAGALVFGASLVLSLGGFGFHALASRRLGVDSYGALYSLISLSGMAGLPVALFTPVITRYAAEFAALHDDSHVRGLMNWLVRFFGIVALVYVLASFVLAAPLGAFLHIATWEIPIVGIMLAVSVASGTMRAIGQGVHAYDLFAASMGSEGITKVAAIFIFALFGLTIARAAGAFVCGLLMGALLISVPLLWRYRNVAPCAIAIDWRRVAATTTGAAVLTLTMTSMGFADVLLVKHFFSQADAGLYAAASLCGKMLLYFVGFVPTLLIPQVTHRHARGERTRKLLWLALGFTGIVSVAGVAGYAVVGHFVLGMLVGHAFSAAVPLLTPYAGAMAALALTNSLASYGISTHRLGFALPLLLSTAATLAAIALFHPSIFDVAVELMLGNILMMFLVSVALVAQRGKAFAT